MYWLYFDLGYSRKVIESLVQAAGAGRRNPGMSPTSRGRDLFVIEMLIIDFEALMPHPGSSQGWSAAKRLGDLQSVMLDMTTVDSGAVVTAILR